MELNYTDYVRRFLAAPMTGDIFSRNVTFQVTEDCNLKCTYCYQTNKGKKIMSNEIGKRIVDYLFELYDKDEPDGFINKQTQVIVLDFIGGEPLLNIDLMEVVCDYFWQKAIETGNIWAETFRISVSTNGLLYFDERVQRFLKKYQNRLSFSISMDGGKNIHDACRVDHAGEGSYDRVIKALRDFIAKYPASKSTKVTLAPENLPYLMDIVGFFIDEGFTQINANTIYETDWTVEHAQFFYTKLKELADFLLEHQTNVNISLFDEDFFRPMDENDNKNWCGGTGLMLAFDPDGIAYPCLRYMDTSLHGKAKPLVIGDCFNGLYSTPEQQETREMLDAITRRSQSTDECFYCPIARGCAWCSAECYQRFGTPNKRNTSSCWMHRARSLANVYYWNKKYQQEGVARVFERYLPDEISLKIISSEELQLLDELIFENRTYCDTH